MRADAGSMRDIVLNHARLVDPVAGSEHLGALVIREGRVAEIAAKPYPPGTFDSGVIDVKGAIVAPGLVDLGVFIGEPGQEHRETFRSASEAAAAGGVTTLVIEPNTSPAIDEPAVVDFVRRRARDTGLVRIHPAAALTKGLAGREMAEFGLLKAAGAVAVTDGGSPVRNAQVMRRALAYAAMIGIPVIHHVEDPDLVGEGCANESEFATRLGLPGVPHAAETIMLERDLRLVRLTGARYHARLISCRESLEVLRRAKEEGLPVTAGVSINHLTLNETDIGAYRTFLKLAPPLRAEEERLALVEAVASGLIDIVISGHNPQDVEQKRLPFAEAAPGAIGLETLLAAGLRLVEAGQIGLPRLIAAMTTGPADLLGLEAGRLCKGSPADLFVLDPEEPWLVEAAALRSRSKNTPFDEARMMGRVRLTMVAGRIVYSTL